MIDKSLVKKRFKKSLKTYEENALAQKKMASKLTELLPLKNYNTVFEIGCATGILTKEIKKNIRFENFFSNDIVEDSKNYVDKIIKTNSFISGDIEEIEINNKFDLIISNACLQWCSNMEQILIKLFEALNEEGILAVSVFGDKNLKEIRNIFNIESNAYSIEFLEKILKNFKNYKTEEQILKYEFENLTEILKHLKYTGANAVKNIKLTKTSLEKYEIEYKKLYSNNGQLTLTYNPVYIVIKK